MEELEKLLDSEMDIVIFSQVDLRLQHQMLKGELILGKNNKQRVRRKPNSITSLTLYPFFNKLAILFAFTIACSAIFSV